MARKDWLALVAVHSDAWLMAVALFYAVKLDREGRCAAANLADQNRQEQQLVSATETA
jgi:hypothetical protein